MKWSWKKIGLWLLALALVAAVYLYREYNRKPADLSDRQPDITISADELVAAFDADETVANKKFLGKTIQVRGKLSALSNQQDTLFNASLGDGIHKVSCLLDKRHADQVKQLPLEKNITLKGICTGYLMDVELNRCVMVK